MQCIIQHVLIHIIKAIKQ